MTALLTSAEVGAVLRVKPQQVLRWARAGKLPATRFNRLWRFRSEVIEQVSREGLIVAPQSYIAQSRTHRAGGKAPVWHTPAE